MLHKGGDSMICGVCGGIAEYFNIDPTIVRLLYVFFTLFSMGAGILLYIAAWIIMPVKSQVNEVST